MNTKEQIIKTAKFYQSLGLVVVIGYAYMRKGGKKSFVPEGRIPDYKINALQVIPGHKLAIIDCDCREGIDGYASLLRICSIPKETVCDISQSGCPRYWFYADSRLKSITGDKSKIDLLTSSSKVIVAPSQVQGGGCYRWQIPLKKLSDLQPMPKLLFEFFFSRQKSELAPVPIVNGMKTLDQISANQKRCLLDSINRFVDSRSGFRVFAWAVAIGLDRESVWSLCSGVPYCKKRGRKWFDFSFTNAELRAVK
jgi:hypothetical protein